MGKSGGQHEEDPKADKDGGGSEGQHGIGKRTGPVKTDHWTSISVQTHQIKRKIYRLMRKPMSAQRISLNSC